MTEAKKPREFWIDSTGIPEREEYCLAHCAGIDLNRTDYVHVIEYSALQALIDENAKLVEKLAAAEKIIKIVSMTANLPELKANPEIAKAYLKEQG